MPIGALRNRPCPLCGLTIGKGQPVEPHLMEKPGGNAGTAAGNAAGTPGTAAGEVAGEAEPRMVLGWSHPECVAKIADTQPPKSSRPVCKHWLRVDCAYGDRCFFQHPQDQKGTASKPRIRYNFDVCLRARSKIIHSRHYTLFPL